MMIGAGALAEGGSSVRLAELEGGEDPGVIPDKGPASTTRVVEVRRPPAVLVFRGVSMEEGLRRKVTVK
jgi:hypothetical protein